MAAKTGGARGPERGIAMPGADSLPADVAPVFGALRRLVHAIHSASRESERSLGLSGAQLFVLTQLDATPSLSINALAERTMTHQSTVSVVVRRLVRRKLVRKVRAEDDGRRVELSLTATGAALLRRAPEAVQTRLAREIGRLAPADRRALRRALGRLVEGLDIPPQDETMFFED